jgi:hypothetical protein
MARQKKELNMGPYIIAFIIFIVGLGGLGFLTLLIDTGIGRILPLYVAIFIGILFSIKTLGKIDSENNKSEG